MKPRAPSRRPAVAHADDWLMTYADMITLLLCFFAIFLTVSITKKDAPKVVRMAQLVSLPVLHTDLSEEKSPTRRLEATVHPVAVRAALTQAKHDRPPAPEARPPIKAEPAPAKVEPSPKPATVAKSPAPPRQTIATPKPAPAPAPGPKGDRITILEIGSAAFFPSGSATLTQSGDAILRRVTAQLNSDQYKGYEITVEGHTDDTPIHTAEFPSNWELSTARAAAVVHYFLDQGIPAQRLRAAGYADTFPKVPNRDAEGNPIPANQALNRRVVIKLEKIEPAQSQPAR